MSQTATTDNNMCTLNAKDGVNVMVPLNVAKISLTIKNMLEDLGDTDEDGNVIPIPNINGSILEKIYSFCSYIHTNSQELDDLTLWLDDKTFIVPLPEWFTEFMNIDQASLFEIILGANFLDIQPLLNMTCKQVASIIRNRTPEELRIIFKNPEEVTEANAATDEATNVVDA